MAVEGEPELVAQLQTNKSGITKIRIPDTASFINEGDEVYNISLKAINKDKGLGVSNFFYDSGVRDIAEIKIEILPLAVRESIDLGEADIRFVSKFTKKENIIAVVGEIHRIEGLSAAAVFPKGFINEMSTMINNSEWRVNGSALAHSDGTRIAVSTEDITESCELQSTYEFSHQYWELQIKDKQIRETIYKWEELIPDNLVGGGYQGKSVWGDFADYQDVIEGEHGVFIDLAEGSIPTYLLGKSVFDLGIEYGGADGKCTVDYGNEGLQWSYLYTPTSRIVAYDNHTGERTWYLPINRSRTGSIRTGVKPINFS